MIFFENFRRFDPPWKTEQKKFFEKLTQNMFKTRLDTFGNDFGHFCNLEKFFHFFENFRRIDPPWNTEQKKFSKKLTQKHVQNTFGQFWERFRAFLQF